MRYAEPASGGHRKETWPEFLDHLRRQGHSEHIISTVEVWVKQPDDPATDSGHGEHGR